MRTWSSPGSSRSSAAACRNCRTLSISAPALRRTEGDRDLERTALLRRGRIGGQGHALCARPQRGCLDPGGLRGRARPPVPAHRRDRRRDVRYEEKRRPRKMRLFSRKLGGSRGEDAVVLSSQAIRGVALGVGVTAIVQAVVGGIGLAITACRSHPADRGDVHPLHRAAGPALRAGTRDDLGVLERLDRLGRIPAGVDHDRRDHGQLLRPVLIRRGADLPLLLIFAGVIGGLLGFGLVGIFVGPVMLAVSYTLVDAWLETPSETGHLRPDAEPPIRSGLDVEPSLSPSPVLAGPSAVAGGPNRFCSARCTPGPSPDPRRAPSRRAAR